MVKIGNKVKSDLVLLQMNFIQRIADMIFEIFFINFHYFKVIRRKYVFSKYLKFNNVKRWDVLKKNEYIFFLG